MRKLGVFGAALLMVASFSSVAMGQAQPAGDPAGPPATRVEHVENGTNWGWLGLLGLAGLMGLRRRREDTTIRTTHPATSTR